MFEKPLNNIFTGFIFFIILILPFVTGCRNDKEKKVTIDQMIHLQKTTLGVTTIASGLNVPWEIAWGPDNTIWITEQSGTVSRIDPENGRKKVLLVIPQVWRKRTSGLLGMALSPDMKNEPFVFLDYAFLKDSIPFSRLVRYTYSNDTLINPFVLLEIPAGSGHYGSRVTISPDRKVLWATGDAQIDGAAQDTASLNGKILRINMDGSVPADNPIKGSYVWAWGFRNMEGLVYSGNGNLYTSEHGDATDDEINLIQKNGNYGWPDIEGMANLPDEKIFQQKHHTIDPLKTWTPTIAPAGLDYYNNKTIPEWDNSLLLVTLKTQSLRVLELNKNGTKIISEKVYLEKKFGRLRDLCISPAGNVYISTSNRDWNPAQGFPKGNDDRIIKIFKIKDGDNFKIRDSVMNQTAVKSKTIYSQYCISCHKENGNGVPGIFPALNGSSKVNGNKAALIKILLNGIKPSGKHQQQTQEAMPSFGFLSNKDIAETLSYVRSHWNNHSNEITPDEVKKVRLKSGKEN
jgi:glucose/arabinose dehydrogenase/mono/diheme cytochrome c family protein